MTKINSTKRVPRWHKNVSRLYAVRMLLCALKRGMLNPREIVDEDEPLAAILGPRKHAELCAEVLEVERALEALDTNSSNNNFLEARLRKSACAGEYSLNKITKRFLREAEQKFARKKNSRRSFLSTNISRLGQMLSLNSAEKKIVSFMVLLDCDTDLLALGNNFSSISEYDFYKNLAFITSTPVERIRTALKATSNLAETGLIRYKERFSSGSDGHRVSSSFSISDFVMLDGLGARMLSSQFDFHEVFEPSFKQTGSPELDLKHFEYLGEEIAVLHAILRGAIAERTPGVQILFTGPPGTGKTALANALAHSLSLPLYAIANGSLAGQAYDRDERLYAFQAAQRVLQSRGQALVLFDEVEDVFPPRSGFSPQFARQKGWTNELLESNPLPSIWVTNSIENIDPAYLRRFTYVLRMDAPPISVRRTIMDRYLGEFSIDKDVLSRVAKNDQFTPADLGRAGNALALTSRAAGEVPDATRILSTVLARPSHNSDSSALMGRDEIPRPVFDPKLINTDLDLEALLNGLRRSGEGRLCLYGLPGTGKTAFAVYIADELDKELVTVSASDWLNPFVGGTEQKIRESFDKAAKSEAVLFVDEADSFLRDRKTANQSWEVTQVNELLKRLEQTRGIVIFATNAYESLDRAVLRRLDIKAEFRALTRDQVATMFARTLNTYDVSASEEELYSASLKIQHLINELVSGDFAAACRSLYVSGQAMSAGNLAAALENEVLARSSHREPGIGFTAAIH